MKNRWIFLGASVSLFTTALVVSVLGANKVVFNSNDYKDSIVNASNTFDIDGNSFSNPDANKISEAIAISESGYTFDFQFVGFEKDQQGHMYLPAGTVGWFTNTERLDLGFDNLQVTFALNVNETVNYLCGAYFSYYPLSLTNIISGTGNQDLVCDVYRSTSSSMEIEYQAGYRFSSSSLANSRYTLFMIEALEQDLYIDSISFSTPCDLPAVSPGAEVDYDDYKDSDKSIFHKYQVDNFPFVGNGSYKFTDDYDFGSLSGIGRINTFDASLDTYLENNGFNFVMNSNGMDMYQKLLDINHAITVGVEFDTGFHYNYYSFIFSTSIPVILSSTSWPTNAVNQAFSSDFAMMLNTYPISDQDLDITYQAAYMEDAQAKQMQMQLTITSSQTHVELQNYFLNTYLANIITNNPEYSIVEDESPYYDTYYLLQSSDGTKSVCITCLDSVMQDEIFLLTIEEENIYNAYPIDELSESTGISKSKLGTYNSSVGSTYKFITSNTIRVNNANYNTIVSEVNAYLTSLIANNGYELLEDRGDYKCVTNDPFDGVEIYANFYGDYVEITTSIRGYETYGSLAQAVNANYKGEDVITAHIFPVLSEGEHEYLVRNVNDRREICISNCVNSDVTAMLSGGTYDYLTDSYLFDEGNEYCELGIRARLDQYSNLVISLVSVDKDELSMLMTSSEVNTYFQEREYFVTLDDTGNAKAYLVDGETIRFLSSTYYDNYITKLTSNGYSHYDFTDQYYNSTSKGLLTHGGGDYHYGYINTLMISSSETAPNDFKEYATYSNEFSAFNSAYDITIPVTGYKYLLIDENTFIANKRCENSIEADLISNGFIKTVVNSSTVVFDKCVNGDYYMVTYQNELHSGGYNFSSDRGFAVYQFRTFNNYLESYATYSSYLTHVNSELLNVIPDLSTHGDDLFIHTYDTDETCVVISILNSVIDEESLRQELVSNGFSETQKDVYTFNTADYQITCQITSSRMLTRLDFIEVVYDWRSTLDLGTDPFNFAYGYSSLIATVDNGNNIYSSLYSDTNAYYFMLKANDLETYKDALQNLGYKVDFDDDEGGHAQYNDKEKEIRVDCYISKASDGIYEVSYQLETKMYKTISSTILNTALVNNGFAGASLFIETFDILYNEGTFVKQSESTCYIEMYGVKSLEEYMNSNGFALDEDIYTKTDSNYI